jgi:hypothetical protein
MSVEETTWPLIRFGVIKEAWRLYKQHAMVWALAMLIVMAAFGVTNGLLHGIFGRRETLGPGGFRLFLPATGAIQFILSTIVSGFFLGGMVRMAGRQIRGDTPRLEDLFSITDCWFDLLLVNFLIGVAVSIGFGLLVLPGFIVSGLLLLAVPLVSLGRLPATGAIIQSFQALKSQWLVAAVFHWILIILACSGLIACFVGVLVTGPLYCLSVALLYQNFFGWDPVTPARKKASDPFPEV